jgi:hypothetical protein
MLYVVGTNFHVVFNMEVKRDESRGSLGNISKEFRSKLGGTRVSVI